MSSTQVADAAQDSQMQDSSSKTEQSKVDLPEGASDTVYIKNLNEKVKLPILKTSLTSLFSTYGKILSVTAHSNLRMRGQAFVAFESAEIAAKAVKEVNGFPLYGKGMQLAFAKSSSDAAIEVSNPDSLAEHKANRAIEKKKQRRGNSLRRKELSKKLSDTKAPAPKSTSESKRPPDLPDEYVPPNKILFVQSVPSNISNSELENLFGAYPNLVDVRSIPGKAIAFAEFGDVNSSTVAREALNGHRFSGEDVGLKITFVRA